MSGAIGYPCQGGPLDRKMLAHPGSFYHVSRWDGEPQTLCDPNAAPPAKMRPIQTGEYRLQQVGPDQLAWVFQGWPT